MPTVCRRNDVSIQTFSAYTRLGGQHMRSNLISKNKAAPAKAQLHTRRKMAEATRVLREQRALRVGAALSKASRETGLFRS